MIIYVLIKYIYQLAIFTYFKMLKTHIEVKGKTWYTRKKRRAAIRKRDK